MEHHRNHFVIKNTQICWVIQVNVFLTIRAVKGNMEWRNPLKIVRFRCIEEAEDAYRFCSNFVQFYFLLWGTHLGWPDSLNVKKVQKLSSL